MQVISDYFQETAYRLGYKPEDLLPITREGVEADSATFTKGMGEKERDYYINKKMVTLIQRQNKIIGQVEKEIKRRELSFRIEPGGNSKLHNPAIVRLLNEHQKIIQRNVKFLNTLQRQRDIASRYKQRLSISSSQSRSPAPRLPTNHSSASRRSNLSSHSAESKRSSVSSKARLELVRSREKEKQKIRRDLFKEREAENSRKSLRAEEEALKKSQRAHTRSQVNRQIVEENRKDLRFLQNAEIKDHFERLKFKLQKTEQIRAKNAERREERQQQHPDRANQKRQAEEASRKALANRYDNKFRTASLRLENHELMRQQARNYNQLTESLKTVNARKNREQMAKQQQEFANALRKNEQKRLQTAELNRYSLTRDTRLRHIGQEVRHELARKNVADLNQRKSLESEAVQRRLSRRFEELQEVEAVRAKLSKERGQVIRELNLQRRTLDAKKQKPKFNSFFDI